MLRLLQINNKKIAYFYPRGAKVLNRHLIKEDLLMASKHVKRCLSSQLMNKIEIKTTMRYYFIKGIKLKTEKTKC